MEAKSSGGGVGFLGLLALLFIGLKLGGVINWSWLWVLAPLWAVPAAILGILAVLIVVFMLAKIGMASVNLFRRKPEAYDPTEPNSARLRRR